MGFLEGIEKVNSAVNNFMWGPIMLVLMVAPASTERSHRIFPGDAHRNLVPGDAGLSWKKEKQNQR